MSTKRWLGNAAAVTDLWTVNLSGTVTSQTYTMTINAKTVTYTSTGGDTVATVLAALVAAWNASVIPEFAELTAAGVGTVGAFTGMTVTQKVSGRPTTITVATGGGATFGITNTIVATGPNFYDNGQNWSGGVTPSGSDQLVFDNGSVGLWYNIATSALIGVEIDVLPGYSGTIGLPLINATGSTTYNEYRATSLTLGYGAIININGPNLQRFNLALGTATASSSVIVLATGSRIDQYTPVILLTGGHAGTTLNITKGDVGVAFYQGTSATITTIGMGYSSNANTDAVLWLGTGATVTNVTKNGGILTTNCAVSGTLLQDVAGGTITINGTTAPVTLTSYAGTVFLNSTGTITTVSLYGSATLSCDGDPRAKTITTLNAYSPNVTVIDNAKTINSGVLTVVTSGLTGLNVQHGGNTSIVYT